jgi:hypothetical protein
VRWQRPQADDTALDCEDSANRNSGSAIQSGVALRFPPQSKGGSRAIEHQRPECVRFQKSVAVLEIVIHPAMTEFTGQQPIDMPKIVLLISILLTIPTTMRAEERKLSVENIRSSSFEDPGAEPIWKFFVPFCAEQPAAVYPEKYFQALSKLPPKLRDVCLLLRYDLERNSGRTQGAALLEDRMSSPKMLKMTAAAYARFGDKQREKMITEIISKLAEHARTLEEADRIGKLDKYVSPLDKYDELWDSVDYDYASAIVKDMKANPTDYTYPQPKPKGNAESNP